MIWTRSHAGRRGWRPDPALLYDSDGLGRLPEPPMTPGLDLDDQERFVLLGNDVDLAAGSAVSPAHDSNALTPQKLAGVALGSFTEDAGPALRTDTPHRVEETATAAWIRHGLLAQAPARALSGVLYLYPCVG